MTVIDAQSLPLLSGRTSAFTPKGVAVLPTGPPANGAVCGEASSDC